MVLGDVERLEVVNLVLHLGSEGDLIAKPREDRFYLPQDERQGMQVAPANRVWDEGQVDPLGLSQGNVTLGFQTPHAPGDPLEDLFLQLIGFRAGRGTLRGGQASQLSQDRCELALLPEKVHAQRLQRFGIGRGPDALARAGPEPLEFARNTLRQFSRPLRAFNCAGASSRLGAALGNGDQLAERLRVPHRQVGEHLPVDVDPGHFETVHELVVGHALAAGGGVDPGDPQLAHVALARPPIAVGVLEGVHDRFVGRPEERPMRHPETLGEVQDLLVAPAGWDTALDAWHLRSGPSYRGPHGADAWHPYRSTPAACCTAACGAGSCGRAGGSFARAGARSYRSWSRGTAWPTRDESEA